MHRIYYFAPVLNSQPQVECGEAADGGRPYPSEQDLSFTVPLSYLRDGQVQISGQRKGRQPQRGRPGGLHLQAEPQGGGESAGDDTWGKSSYIDI